ncbi:MAG: hypothetical protein Q8Q65_00120 [bacterium]|nr:hypothetical protein [bacterium]
MSDQNSKLAELLHDFKSPLSSSNMALQFIVDGRSGQVDEQVRVMLQEVISRQKGLLEKIVDFEKNHD